MQEDHIKNDSDKFIPETIPYMIDVSLPERHSQDKSLNERGTVLMDMCISSGLRILNGRKPGDSLGYFICHKYNGSSTVDYGIFSECLFRDIFMYTKPWAICPTTAKYMYHCVYKIWISQGKCHIILWWIHCQKDTCGILVAKALCAMSGQISNVVDSNFLANEIGVGAALASFTTIVTTAADSSLRKTTHKPKTKKTNNKLYGPSLHKLRNEVKKCGRMLCAFPHDPNIRGIYYKNLK